MVMVMVVVTDVIACAFFFFFWSPLGCIVEAVGQVGSNLLLTYLGSKSTLSMWSGLTWDER